jgi:hypothetical protein
MNEKYEFRFVTILASHVDSIGESGGAQPDARMLEALGKQGWKIAGIMPDPLHPGAKFIVSLQRELAA